ncbi:hypothetical protein [Ammoniphilus sp. CFH 90114]|uniref:hypothetical protein n=1 Tax=Ammoniphilus sp. CFH 90114 TaxID=2493665 RepID=UPI00100E79D0|nr:hypothetical protein [Ammoniphilus sp. CFH 90114]RXT00625.1 hypothetical protein EIZ39_25900 [Ammoniphilus sp. CFH 90114]
MKKLFKFNKFMFCSALLFASLQGVAMASSFEGVQPDQVRMELLEKAVTPTAPREVIQTWSHALQQRNGAVQYALLSKELRDPYLLEMEQLNWVTGVSSPWIQDFSIKEQKKISDQKSEFLISFEVTDSTQVRNTERARITLELRENKWVITRIELDKDTSISARTPYLTSPYVYEEMDFRLPLPSDWKGKLRMEKSQDGARTDFLYTPQDPAKVTGLMSIERMSVQDWVDWGQETGMHTYLGEKNGKVYTLVKASENPFASNPSQLEYAEFQEMLIKVKDLVTRHFSFR